METDSQTEGWFNLIRSTPPPARQPEPGEVQKALQLLKLRIGSQPPVPEVAVPDLASVVLYSTTQNPDHDHWPVQIMTLTLWVRGSVLPGVCLEDATKQAAPREGESVLAVIPFPGTEEEIWGMPMDAADDLDPHKFDRTEIRVQVIRADFLADLKPGDFDILMPGGGFARIERVELADCGLGVRIHVAGWDLERPNSRWGVTLAVAAEVKVMICRRPEDPNRITPGFFPELEDRVATINEDAIPSIGFKIDHGSTNEFDIVLVPRLDK